MKMNKVGSEPITEAAACPPQSTLYCPVKFTMPTMIVRLLACCVKMNDYKKSFHIHVN